MHLVCVSVCAQSQWAGCNWVKFTWQSTLFHAGDKHNLVAIVTCLPSSHNFACYTFVFASELSCIVNTYTSYRFRTVCDVPPNPTVISCGSERMQSITAVDCLDDVFSKSEVPWVVRVRQHHRVLALFKHSWVWTWTCFCEEQRGEKRGRVEEKAWVTERELCCWLCLSRQVQTYWRNLNIGLCARVCVRVWLNRLQTQITIENLSMKTCLNLATRKKDASCLANTLVCCTCHVCWWVFMWVNNEILIHWENLRMFFF